MGYTKQGNKRAQGKLKNSMTKRKGNPLIEIRKSATFSNIECHLLRMFQLLKGRKCCRNSKAEAGKHAKCNRPVWERYSYVKLINKLNCQTK